MLVRPLTLISDPHAGRNILANEGREGGLGQTVLVILVFVVFSRVAKTDPAKSGLDKAAELETTIFMGAYIRGKDEESMIARKRL